MIEFKNVTVGYKDKKKKRNKERYEDDHFIAAKDVSFTINPGDCLGVIGPNGSGKTSILKSLIGIKDTLRGDILKPQDIKLGYNHGESEMIEHQTIRENINVMAVLNDVQPKIEQERVNELNAVVEFKSFLDIFPKDASSGMRQKANFIRSLIASPELLVLDEPTSAVDIVGVDSIQKLIKHELKKGAAIALTSHYPFEIAMLCNKLLILVDGDVQFYGATKDLINLESDEEFITALKSHIFELKIDKEINDEAA